LLGQPVLQLCVIYRQYDIRREKLVELLLVLLSTAKLVHKLIEGGPESPPTSKV